MKLPSRFRRLDGALADLPLEEPMLLSELDGFLTGIVLAPEPIGQTEWMQNIWGRDEDGTPPFEDPADVRWFADAVVARRNEIARDLARGRPQPLFDVDERNGDILWEGWVDGFAEAMALRPDAWTLLGEMNEAAGTALSRLQTLIAIVANETMLDSVEVNAIHDAAADDVVAAMLCLHAATSPARQSVPLAASAAKIGRNDPCSCGSGRKSKRCCG